MHIKMCLAICRTRLILSKQNYKLHDLSAVVTYRQLKKAYTESKFKQIMLEFKENFKTRLVNSYRPNQHILPVFPVCFLTSAVSWAPT